MDWFVRKFIMFIMNVAILLLFVNVISQFVIRFSIKSSIPYYLGGIIHLAIVLAIEHELSDYIWR